MRRFALALALVALTVAPVLAQGRTPRKCLNYTNSEPLNATIDKLDRDPSADSKEFLAYCGNQANAGTTFLASVAGPALFSPDPYARAVGDATCDARGSATEATADEVVVVNYPVQIVGMQCIVETAPTAAVVFTARAGVANLSPSLTCTIAATQTSCYVNAPPPNSCIVPTVAGGVPVAVQNTTTTNESAVGALCRLFIGKP